MDENDREREGRGDRSAVNKQTQKFKIDFVSFLGKSYNYQRSSSQMGKYRIASGCFAVLCGVGLDCIQLNLFFKLIVRIRFA